MEKVLLLNASYTPLRVISFKRAIVLLLQEKAEIVEEATGSINSASRTFTMPSVIRLNYMVKIPYRARIALNRRSVLARDGGICQYNCGRKANTIDHVHPRSRGGKHTWDNVLAACSKCNAEKGDLLLSELGWEPIKQPHAPSSNVWLVAGIMGREEWSEYLAMV